MQQLLANLSIRQRISIAVVAIGVLAAVYALVHYRQEADFKPLFTGVSAEDAGGIVQKLKEAGVDYRLPESGGSVLVPSARVAELRLNMAAAGLPKSGRIGFELFDKTNLGATEFTEHVNYRRALEGELERSVMSMTEVEQARVHLTFPKDSVFVEQQQPAKASVLIKVKPGARLAPNNVMAINHLVSSAVEGLSPDAVSVLDMNGNLLGRPKPTGTLDGSEPSEAILDYRHKVEADLLLKVNATLEPLLGANRFRAGISVECDFSGGEVSEEVFDPTRSVMVSSQRTEDNSGATTATGVPGTASSLPRPTSRPGNGAKAVSRFTENVTYQTTRTVKKMRLPAGGIRKMSLAVMVDQELHWERDGNGYKRMLVPPTPEKLKIIKDMVAGVTGFNAERGDQFVIDTLPFETTLQLEPPASMQSPGTKPTQSPQPPWRMQLDKKQMIMAGGGAGVLLLLVATLWFLGRRGKKKSLAVQVSGPAELAAPAAGTGNQLEDQMESKLAERDALQHKLEAQALNSLKLAPVITKTSEVLAKHLREKITKEPEVSSQILRAWVREEEPED